MERFKQIFEHATIGIAICNAKNRRLEMLNPTFAHIHGYEVDELMNEPPGKTFSPQCMSHSCNDNCTCYLDNTTFESVHIKKDGSNVPVFVSIAIIKNFEGKITHRIIYIIDISERKTIEDELFQTTLRLSSLLNTIPDLIWLKDPDGTFRACNNAFEKFFGVSENEIVGCTDYDLISPLMANSCRHFDRQVIDKRHLVALEEELRSQTTGHSGLFLTRKAPVYSPDNQLLGILGIARDITAQKHSEEQIDRLLHFDVLTELPNRLYAKIKTEELLNQNVNAHGNPALILIDLDDFKTVNKTFGHTFGDVILTTAAKKLKRHLCPNDILCRLGGDEFLIVLPEVSEHTEIINLIQTLFDEFRIPLTVSDLELTVSMSIGVSLYPQHGTTFDSLLQKADAAMYLTKETGRNGYTFFDNRMNSDMAKRFHILSDIKMALDSDQFMLYYQPQIDMATNYAIGAEALLRWHNPQMGMISPIEFIPIAESSGLIVPLGEWIINQACTQGARWHAEGIYITIAVNISAIQFKRGNLEEVIQKAIQASGFDPKFLEIELTESIMMQNTSQTLEIVSRLKAMGIQLTIDDFGTGYSSLSYLKQFAVDKLKIDQSFIRDILNNPEDAVIVKTVIQMSRSLSLITIAEGVENADVLDLLRQYDCDEVQGHHFAKPMNVSDATEFFRCFCPASSLLSLSQTDAR